MRIIKTIFIVDDDEDDRLFLREAIEENIKDVKVVDILGGEELYREIERNDAEAETHLILVDMNMPRLNGLEIVSYIKQSARWKRVPIVMVSTTSTPDLVNKAYNMGVNAFITKPVYPKEYEMLAQTIGLCFLNTYSVRKLPAVHKNSRIKNVIVIEDNDDHWHLMDFSLKSTVPGISTIRLKDRSGAIDFFHHQYRYLPLSPEFILLDLYLPGREDGLALLNEIRKHIAKNKLLNVPIIVFSYSSHADDANASLHGQANAYLLKPSDGGIWPSYLENLCNILSTTIKLPKDY